MSSPASASPSPISALFTTLGNELLTDVTGNAAGLLTAFLKNIQIPPTPQNVAAQGAILAASAMLQLPNLEAQGIGQLATLGLAALATIKPPTV